MNVQEYQLEIADENAAAHARRMLCASSTPADVETAVRLGVERDPRARPENVAALVMASRAVFRPQPRCGAVVGL